MEENIFIKNKIYKGGYLLPRLIVLRGHKCQCCGNTQWLGQPITLQTHHIDGDRSNNTLDNLQLLCPNCHSYTDTFGSKNILKKHNATISDEQFKKALENNFNIRQALLQLHLSDASANYDRAYKIMQKYNITQKIPEYKNDLKNYCIDCGKEIAVNSKRCYECSIKARRTTERPDRATLKILIRNKPFTQIANEYGVSDKAIVKWCLFEGLPHRKKDIKNYSDAEWALI